MPLRKICNKLGVIWAVFKEHTKFGLRFYFIFVNERVLLLYVKSTIKTFQQLKCFNFISQRSDFSIFLFLLKSLPVLCFPFQIKKKANKIHILKMKKEIVVVVVVSTIPVKNKNETKIYIYMKLLILLFCS